MSERPSIDLSLKRRKLIERVFRARGSYACHYCDKPLRPDVGPTGLDFLTVDHIIPLAIVEGVLASRYPTWNLVFACRLCNKLKGSKTYEEHTGESLPAWVPWRSTDDALWASRFKLACRELRVLVECGPPPSLRRTSDSGVYTIDYDDP